MSISFFGPVIASALALTSPAHPAGATLSLALHNSSGAVSTVTLECEPPGGTHPKPVHACRALGIADGDFDSLPHEGAMCPWIWSPVTATATGSWRGSPVLFGHTYPNWCVAAAESGGVFAF